MATSQSISATNTSILLYTTAVRCHRTRRQNKLLTCRTNHAFANRCLRYAVVIIYSQYRPMLDKISRGDWGTLRRENLNPPNIYLVFEIKDFGDTYEYSTQWGIFKQKMAICRNV